MIIAGIIATLSAGFIGGILGTMFNMDFPEFGVVAAVAVMGGFIMAEIRKKGGEGSQ